MGKGHFNLAELGIQPGAILTFTEKGLHETEKRTCTVKNDTQVEYKGKEYSLSDLAKEWLTEFGNSKSGYEGPKYFTYNGKTLKELKKEFDKRAKKTAIKNIPLNQILYGAPGTGKTYSTVIKAMEIIDNQKYDKVDNNSYNKLLKRFNNLKKAGQIEFVTFHQSMSYEDFIEGIKPEIFDKEQSCASNKTKKGAKEVKGDIKYVIKDGIFKIISEKAQRRESEAGNKSKDKNKSEEKPENKDKKYVLIIDEINRGNISKIFGELITLIEETKRIEPGHYDNPEKSPKGMTSKLPYTQKSFGVPDNLYIIGTMNTSDRSIAAIDIALRRRFTFVPMRPIESLVDKDNIIENAGIHLKKIFETINSKIEILLDEDHKIGHSYFMNDKCKDIASLKQTWFYEIMPLINEYFYGDWENLRFILKDFVIEIPEAKSILGDLSKNFDGEKFYKFATIEEYKDDDEKFKKDMNELLAKNKSADK